MIRFSFGRDGAWVKPEGRRGGALWILVTTLVFGISVGQASPDTDVENPVIATYDGGEVRLDHFEEYVREMPLSQRISFARSAGEWREFMAGNLVQMTALTSRAMTMGLHLDPGYLRARDYFINEYMSFLVLRDEISNRMDVSVEAQAREYATSKADFLLSPTVSLRVIRTRDADAISSAVAALESGGDFHEIEMEYSQVSPRYRGQVLGPYPTRESRVMIPPPDAVIQAAFAMDPGQTTGPMKIGEFHFLAQTVAKTDGRQQEQVEVAEVLEERLRKKQGDVLIRSLLDRMTSELGVEVDEELFANGTRMDDVLATIGVVRITRQEYTDLNGTVRGPASEIASILPTKLKQFVLPYMMSQWARFHGFDKRREFELAMRYYEMQHLASRVEFALADEILPLPSDEELRKQFEANIESYRTSANPNPRFEDFKDEMLSILMQEREPEVRRRLKFRILGDLNFKMTENPQSGALTALEAVIAGHDKFPADARLAQVRPVDLVTAEDGSTPYTGIGRARSWDVDLTLPDGASSTIRVDGPGTLVTSLQDYAAIPAMTPWQQTWRFDTDTLKRHGVDKALGDFIAKYGGKVRVTSHVEFLYANDDPTSPSDCLVVYEARPIQEGTEDNAVMVYSGNSGDIVKRGVGGIEVDPCPTCPGGVAATTSLQVSSNATTGGTSLKVQNNQ